MKSSKLSLVTGSNGDIGKAIVRKLIKNNYKVICQVRRADNEFKKFLKSLKKNSVEILQFDLTNYEDMQKKIKALYEKKNSLDLLVNCAGISSGSILEMTSIDEIKKVFDVNFFSQIKISQNLIRLLKKSDNPSIINIGSITGITPEKGTIAYGSSKAAFMFASRVMANELSRYNIRVNAIAPSITNTKMLKKMDQKVLNRMKDENFLKKICEPDEIAELIIYLSSEKSKFINGQIIRLDGGTKF